MNLEQEIKEIVYDFTFINDKLINNLPFEEHFSKILFHDVNNYEEYFSACGAQHYRLLSYFSSLFHHSNIIDIGTHRGNSSLALSYNKTNTIHTFDIVSNINPHIMAHTDNVICYKDNIFDEETANNKYKELILSCPFILLDVDPHDGGNETIFYEYLKKIDYKGFVICDDIWYFKEMRDNFWYNISHVERYDLTHLGHWSGTGIINFNRDKYKFKKNNNDDWTLVTSYFDLTKCPDASKEIKDRNQDYYLSHANSTLHLPYNLVIYCDAASLPKIMKIRPDELKEKTKYIVREFDEFQIVKNGNSLSNTFVEYRNKINKNRQEKPYHFDNRNTASYYLFCLSRYIMLKEMIELNPFESTHFAWINFCIERMGYTNLIHLDEALSVHRDKFSTCYIDYIPQELVQNTPEYFKWGRCSMCSGFFTGNKKYMYEVCDKIENKFLEYVEAGYGHADEQLYSPVYFENPDLFEHYFGDYQQMITNYVYVYEKYDTPLHCFIKNSLNHGNNKKCMEACSFLYQSVLLKKIKMSPHDFNQLYQCMKQCC